MTEPLRLYLLRHAKSSWKTGEADFDRPLNKRGRKDAEAVAELIVERGDRPALILCSAAQRARETLLPILARFDGEAEVITTRLIYEADADVLLALIRRSGTAPSVMVVGHNPTLEDLTRRLTGDGETDAVTTLRNGFPPAGLASLEFTAGAWSEIGEKSGRLLAFSVPAKA